MLLSVCIPTYNRADFLKETFRNLLPQLVNYLDYVEVIVSDNASNDNTESVVKGASDSYNIPIRYYKQSQNFGTESNIDFVIKQSIGEYLYIMGDDDILAPNYISSIIQIISESNSVDSVYCNRLSGDSQCNNNKLFDSKYKGETIEVLPADEFIMRVLDGPTFISSIVVKKKVMELGKDYRNEEYEGFKTFAQLLWGLYLLGGRSVYYYMPLVIQRNPSKTWAVYWPKYFISSLSNIFYDLNDKIPGIYKLWSSKLRIGVPRCIATVGRAHKYYSSKEIRKQMLKHLTGKEKLLYFFYLIPGTYSLRQLLARVKHSL